MPAGTNLPETAIPKSIPALAGEPVSLAGDGAPVYPQIVTPASPGVAALTGDLRLSVDLALPVLKESVRLGQWNGADTTHAGAKTTRNGMQAIYFGRAEIRNARILELQQALGREPARIDMEPLRRFLESLKIN